MLSDHDRLFRLEIKISHLARLFQIVTDVFGIPHILAKLRSMEGMEVEAYFPQLNQTYARICISNCHFNPLFGKSEHPVATVIFNSPEEGIIPIVNDVLRTNASLGGLVKLFFKYMLTRKIIIKGSLFKAIIFIQCIMIGKHPMYIAEQQAKADLQGGQKK